MKGRVHNNTEDLIITIKNGTPNRALLAIVFSCRLVTSAGTAVAGYDERVAAYERGDYVGAFEEFSAAAEQGDAKAQNYLGILYKLGLGTPKHYATAVKWYRKAAEQGHIPAQSNLSDMYANSEGVPQDDAKAAYWLSLPVDKENSLDAVKDRLDEMRKELKEWLF